MIVDMQVHLWNAPLDNDNWASGQPLRPELHRAEDLLPLMDEVGVDRVIIVPPPGMNGYALECAARWPDRFAVMGRFHPLTPDAPEQLETWLDQPGMVGLRIPFHPDEQRVWPGPDALDWFFAAAERLRIPVALMASEALETVAPVAERHPDLTLIVDHLGWPREGKGEHRQLDVLFDLARYPNVYAKASAIALKSAGRYPYADLFPIVRAAYEAFGADRLLWGSDWTQTLTYGKGTYREDVDWLRVATDFIPEADRRKILGESACRVLGWPPGVPSTDRRLPNV